DAPHATPLSLHDALPISTSITAPSMEEMFTVSRQAQSARIAPTSARGNVKRMSPTWARERNSNQRITATTTTAAAKTAAILLWRSEEHTSELQSRSDLVC